MDSGRRGLSGFSAGLRARHGRLRDGVVLKLVGDRCRVGRRLDGVGDGGAHGRRRDGGSHGRHRLNGRRLRLRDERRVHRCRRVGFRCLEAVRELARFRRRERSCHRRRQAREPSLLVAIERDAAPERLTALELAHQHLTRQDGKARRERGCSWTRLGRGLVDLDDHDRAPDSGDGVRRLDFDRLAGLHALLGNGDRGPTQTDVDGGDARRFADRERRALAHRDDRPASEQDAGDGIVARRDAILHEHVVLELQRDRLGERGARDRRRSLQRGHHTRFIELSKPTRRRDDKKSDQSQTNQGNALQCPH